MKFKATYANLAVSVRLEGRKPELVQFVNGMFETEDPEIIEALSNYQSDNPKAKIVEFRSDEEPAEEPAKPAKKSKSQQKREKAMDEAKAPEKAEEPVEEGAESAPVEVADTASEPEKKPSKKGSKK